MNAETGSKVLLISREGPGWEGKVMDGSKFAELAAELGEHAYLVHLHDLQDVLVVRRWPGGVPCDLCPNPVAAYRVDGTLPGSSTSYLCGDCCRHARHAADAGYTPESWVNAE